LKDAARASQTILHPKANSQFTARSKALFLISYAKKHLHFRSTAGKKNKIKTVNIMSRITERVENAHSYDQQRNILVANEFSDDLKLYNFF